MKLKRGLSLLLIAFSFGVAHAQDKGSGGDWGSVGAGYKLLGIQLVVVGKTVPEERERFGRGATTSGNLGTAVRQRVQSRELLIDPHRVVRAQHTLV